MLSGANSTPEFPWRMETFYKALKHFKTLWINRLTVTMGNMTALCYLLPTLFENRMGKKPALFKRACYRATCI